MSKISSPYDIFARQICNGYNMCPAATKVFHTSSLFCKWVNKADSHPLVIPTIKIGNRNEFYTVLH